MFDALVLAARAQLRPRMLALVLLPLAGALLLWVVVFAAAWHSLVDGFRQMIEWGAAKDWIGDGVARFLSEWIVALVLLVFLLPLTQLTALLVTATIAMPVMVADVAARDFPLLERRRGGTIAGSIANSLSATLIYFALWVLSLPLWLFGIPAFLLPVLFNAWLNARLFRYDALAEHASADEYAIVMMRSKGSLYGLGVVAAALQMVPILNLLLSPLFMVFSGLSFIYFELGELARLRARSQS